MAIKRPGAYVPLAVNYADDEAIMDAGEDAELMYSASWRSVGAPRRRRAGSPTSRSEPASVWN
jgi:hypothetical protein